MQRCERQQLSKDWRIFAVADNSCVSSCISDAYNKGAACLTQPDAGACLVGVGTGFVACAQSCEGTALRSAEGCKAGFLSCQTACGGVGSK